MYLLYEIRSQSEDSDVEINSDSESEEPSSEDSKRAEDTGKKSDDDDEEIVDIFTDILSLLVLKKRERLVPARVKVNNLGA